MNIKVASFTVSEKSSNTSKSNGVEDGHLEKECINGPAIITWFSLCRRALMAKASLCMCTDSAEHSLPLYIKYECR